MQIGAYSAGAEPDISRYTALSKVGDLIGLGFQIMDDVLDVTQSTEVLGSPQDLMKPKRRILFLNLWACGVPS